jgi:hypothetical protein
MFHGLADGSATALSHSWKRRLELDAIARGALAEAVGEPGYAVLLIFDRVDNDYDRRIAVNLLWKLMEKTSAV